MEFGSLTPPPQSAEDQRRRKRNRRRAALFVILVAGASAVTMRSRGSRTPAAEPMTMQITERPKRVVPDSVRIKVEVVNATATRGLGRLATAWLRDKGFDVVSTTTASEADRRDSSLVLDRSGHADWAALAAAAISGARVESRPDSLRYLDITVLIGRSWRPPPQTLYP